MQLQILLLFNVILHIWKGITSSFFGTEEFGKQLLHIAQQSIRARLLRSIWSTQVFQEIKLISAIIHKISQKKKRSITLSIWYYSVLLLKDFTPVAGVFITTCESKSYCHYLHQVVYHTQMFLSSSQYMLLQTRTFTLNN